MSFLKKNRRVVYILIIAPHIFTWWEGLNEQSRRSKNIRVCLHVTWKELRRKNQHEVCNKTTMMTLAWGFLVLFVCFVFEENWRCSPSGLRRLPRVGRTMGLPICPVTSMCLNVWYGRHCLIIHMCWILWVLYIVWTFTSVSLLNELIL